MKKRNRMDSLKRSIILMLILLFIGAGSLPSVTASAIVDDNFDSPTLGSDWVISPGRGSYSLTANPDHLRYIIDARHVSNWGPGGGGYAKALHLIRPFSGDQWTLTTEVTYNIRPASPTNNRNMYMGIIKPGDFSVACAFGRSGGAYDSNPWSNSLSLWAGDGVTWNTTGKCFPNSPGPLPLDTMYFEIVRNGDHIVIRASTDGDTTFELQMEYTFSPGKLGLDQEFVISGGGWWGSNSPPGYADIDFLKVVPNIVPATVDIDPDKLNLKSKGKWVTGYIEVQDEYDVSDIDVSTLKISMVGDTEVEIYAEDHPSALGDNDGDGIPDLMVKFSRPDLINAMQEHDEDPEIGMVIEGEFDDGTKFQECGRWIFTGGGWKWFEY